MVSMFGTFRSIFSHNIPLNARDPRSRTPIIHQKPRLCREETDRNLPRAESELGSMNDDDASEEGKINLHRSGKGIYEWRTNFV